MNRHQNTSNPDEPIDELLQGRIADLERQLQDLYSRLPAHSIPPAMQAELDELDEQLAEARRQLSSMRSR